MRPTSLLLQPERLSPAQDLASGLAPTRCTDMRLRSGARRSLAGEREVAAPTRSTSGLSGSAASARSSRERSPPLTHVRPLTAAGPLCSIRNRLTKLKKDRTEYIRAKDVLSIYNALLEEGTALAPRAYP